MTVDFAASVAGTSTVHAAFGVTVDVSETAAVAEGLSVAIDEPATATVTLAESLSVGDDTGYHLVEPTVGVVDSVDAEVNLGVSLAEHLAAFDAIQTTSFVLQSIGPREVRVTFPTELRLDGAVDASHYGLAARAGGVPAHVLLVTPTLVEKTSGSDGVVLPSPRAYGSLSFPTSTSGTEADGLPLEALGVRSGDTLHVDSGPNEGSYLVVSVTGSTLVFSPALTSFPAASASYRIDAPASFETRLFASPSHDFSGSVGDYVSIAGALGNAITYARIEEVVTPRAVRLDRPLSLLDPAQGSLPWTQFGAVAEVTLTTDETTRGGTYRLSVRSVRTKDGRLFSAEGDYVTVGDRPRVVSALCLPEDGTVVVTYDERMRQGEAFSNPSEYQIVGPTPVTVTAAHPVGETTVALKTLGLQAGTYRVIVNATGTPHDVAGNPVDPDENALSFQATTPTLQRSIFTDHGPIAKPPLVLASGAGVTLTTYVSPIFGPGSPFTSDELVFTGGAFTADAVGLYVDLAGTEKNNGRYRVLSVLSPTRVRLQGSFRLPDAANGSGTWQLINPRDGQIADSPADVQVLVDGSPVEVEEVWGLLGQIVLAQTPGSDADVSVDYAWVPEPTVEFRRLNSHEFLLNKWTYDEASPTPSQHVYRYRNAIVDSADYAPEDALATLASPLNRDLFYHAFERAYSGLLNDPNLLLLNTPLHRIAYPPLSREIPSVSVAYEALTLPEADPTDPWDRSGSGTASLDGGELVVVDSTGDDFLRWGRGIDLSFPHVFAGLWRLRVEATPVTDGVFTGVSAGWSDGLHAVIVGYLLVGGVRMIGFLKSGVGSDLSLASSWAGGLLGDTPTGTPTVLDWSVAHSYRVLRGADGVVRLFVDGESEEALRATAEELPSLDELDLPFERAQEIFFGSLSRIAASTSRWDFVRYLILPTNPVQSSPFLLVDYVPSTTPETALAPWTPLGSAGTETLVAGVLVLDATGASPPEESSPVTGDFRGFSRLEPLLQVSSDVVIETRMRVRSWTHGLSPSAVAFAIDDGDRLLQASFLASSPSPRVGYAGRALPEEVGWSRQGNATYRLAGQMLRIEDAAIGDGVVFFREETAAQESDRVLSATANLVLEFRTKVVSQTPDPQGFAGFSADVADGWQAFGVGFYVRSGVPKVALEGDGTPVAGGEFNASWGDGAYHTYRLVRSFDLGSLVVGGSSGQTTGSTLVDPSATFLSAGVVPGDRVYIPSGPAIGFHRITGVPSQTTLQLAAAPAFAGGLIYEVRRGGNAVVSLFEDTLFLGVVDLDLFPTGVGAAVVSFGTTTPASFSSMSVVELAYTHAWRVLSPRPQTFLGFWKGTSDGSLLDYHLPLKASGVAAVSGQMLLDASQSFSSVTSTDVILIDVGTNRGIYRVASASPGVLTLLDSIPSGPSQAAYRIPLPHDWTVDHDYRLAKSPEGAVTIGIDGDEVLRVSYGALDFPPSTAGIFSRAHAGMPSISWGAFDPDGLSQTSWSNFRYQVTSSGTGEDRIVPPHHVLNERNVMASPEHLSGTVPHDHTQFSASSTGFPYPWEGFVENPAVRAFTQLNEGTPLVPQTQTYEVRQPTPVIEHVSALNDPGSGLNDPSFTVNDGETRVRLIVPDDVLYNDLQIVERAEGEEGLLAPFYAEVRLGALFYQKEVCLTYHGDVLPEQDTTAQTPWTRANEPGADVVVSASSGILTYSIGPGGGQTLYRNDTPLTDPVGLETAVTFRVKVASDTSEGTGDTGVRVGFSAFGLTAALSFVTTPLGDREVRLLDLNANEILAAVPVDYLDGQYHSYRLVKNVAEGTLDVLVDPEG